MGNNPTTQTAEGQYEESVHSSRNTNSRRRSNVVFSTIPIPRTLKNEDDGGSRFGLLKPQNCMMFVCDMQEGYSLSVKYFDEIVANTEKLIKVAEILCIPTVIGETEGMGPTVKGLGLANPPKYLLEERSTLFTMVSLRLRNYILTMGIRTAILCGLEAHGAIQASGIDLKIMGVEVFVIVDACSSRGKTHRSLGFGHLRRAGCWLLTTETAMKSLADNAHLRTQSLYEIVTEKTAEAGLSDLDSSVFF